jgi:integrase
MVDIGRDPATGKRRLKSVGGFRTRRDAERALSKMLEQINQGTYAEPSRMTLAEYLPGWLEAARLRGLRQTTLVGYEVMISRQLIPRIGALQLRELTPAHLNSLYLELLERGRLQRPGGLSPRTVRAAHTVLRRALRDAVRQGLLTRNVADLADPPSAAAARAEARKAVKTWTPGQLRQFLERTHHHLLYPAFLLGALTGMRRGEVLGLRWTDVDLDEKRLTITQTLVAPRYKLVFSEPKTAAGRRTVALDDRTVTALREHRRRHAAKRLEFGRDYQETGLVFTREDGSPIVPLIFTQRFQKASRDAGLPQIRFHDLRHGHVTYLMQAGVPLPTIAQRVGHSSVAVTGDIYSHVRPEVREQIADVAASIVFG